MAFLLYFLRIIFMTPGHLNYEWGKFLFMESVGDNSYSFTTEKIKHLRVNAIW